MRLIRGSLFVAAVLACVVAPAFAQQPTRSGDLTKASVSCPDAGCLVQDVQTYGSVGFQVTGTFVATIQIEGSIDNTNFVSVACLPNGGTATVTSLTATGVWTCPTAGLRSLRWRVSAYTSGTATVTAQATVAVARSLFPLLAPSVMVSGTGTFGVSPQIDFSAAGVTNNVSFLPSNIFGRLFYNTSSSTGGLGMYGIAPSTSQNAFAFYGIGVGALGTAATMTAPLFYFRTATTLGSGTVTKAIGQLAKWNQQSAEDYVFWCYTDQATCSAADTSGTRNYLFDFSLGSTNATLKTVSLVGSVWKPAADSTTALTVANASGTAQWVFDTAESSGNRLSNTGAAPGQILDLSAAANAATAIYLNNTTSGTAAKSSLRLQAGTQEIDLISLSQGFTTSNRFVQGHGLIDATSNSGLDIASSAGTDFWTNNTKNFSIASGGKIGMINAVATAGMGVPAIYGENISSTQTANFTALTQSPGAVAGRWECEAVLTTTSATNTGTLQVTIDYVDSQGATHTADILPLAGAAGTFGTTQTSVASKEFYTAPKRITVNNANTNIVLKVVITGTVSYTVSPRCLQEA